MCNLSIIGLIRGRFPESFAHAQTVDTRPLFPPPTWPGHEANPTPNTPGNHAPHNFPSLGNHACLMNHIYEGWHPMQNYLKKQIVWGIVISKKHARSFITTIKILTVSLTGWLGTLTISGLSHSLSSWQLIVLY